MSPDPSQWSMVYRSPEGVKIFVNARTGDIKLDTGKLSYKISYEGLDAITVKVSDKLGPVGIFPLSANEIMVSPVATPSEDRT